MTALDELEANTRRLLEEHRALKAQYADLQQQNVLLDGKVFEQRKELEQLRARLRRLEVARALSETDETRQDAKNVISGLITRVDRAIELVNQI